MPRRYPLSTVLSVLGLASLLCLPRARAQAAGERLQFERLSVEEGLSQVSVRDVLQDRRGFLWFATADGLNRYDGYGFTVYRPEPGNPRSLSGNLVTALYEDAEGTLWVGTTDGLNRLDRWRGTFTRYQHDPRDSTSLGGDVVAALGEGPSGKLWVGTRHSGLHRLDDARAGTFTHFRHDPQDSTSLASDEVSTLHTGADGTLWAGTLGGGLERFRPADETFAHALPGRAIAAVYGDSTGALWVGTYRDGLHHFDPEQGVTATYRHAPGDPKSLTEGPVLAVAPRRAPAGKTLWVGTGGGLNVFDPRTGTAASYRHRTDDPESLSSDYVTDVVEGRFGTLWVGTREGVSRSDYQSGTFTVYRHRSDDLNSLSESSIFGVCEDEDGMLWVGTLGGGLNRLDPQSGDVTRYRHAPGRPQSLASDLVADIYEDHAGRLWVATFAGLDRLDRQAGAFAHYTLGAPDSTRAKLVTVLHEAPDGTLWAGTSRGLYRFDPERGVTTAHYRVSDDPRSAGENNVYDIAENGDGRLWIGMEQGGLSLFDPAMETAERFQHDPDDPASLGNDFVVAVHRDRRGRLWAATYGGGLDRFDPDAPAKGFTHYTAQNSGLPSNTLAGLLEDDEGHLWISTYAGLVEFDPERETFRTYGPDRGVQSTEFNLTAYHQARDGQMFFGGVNGLNAFYPEDVDINPHPPEVVLTEAAIRTHGSTERDSVLRPPADGAAATRLAYDQNDFSFKYVGLHYAAPQRNTYAYQLDGYDAGWQDAGTRRQALYTNLDPGDYTFRVKAANRDGVWSAGAALLSFTIRPPWWRTWWAYGAYALLVAAGALAVDRFQRRRVVRRERERAELREAELKAEMAEQESARKTQELEEARQLQLSMLPEAMPVLPQAELAAHMRTATEVGGDYYDFRRLDDGALLIAIGDATGHGARAGTMVTAAKTLFNGLPEEQRDLAQGLADSTRVLRRLGMRRLYMALALARLDGSRLALAGAGLPPALLYRAAAGTVEEVPLKGMPLGGVVGYPYRQHTLDLGPGDVVVLMSDGFPETFDEDDRMLGYDRAAGVLCEAAGRAPRSIIERFEEVARQWSGTRPPGDDATFVVLKMNAAPGPG